MSAFCVRKENIEKLQGVIKKLSDSNQFEKLTSLSTEDRVSQFAKVMTQDEAVLLNKELEKAIASERLSALKKWIKNNLDVKYRESLEKKIDYLGKNFKSLDEVDNFIESRVDRMAEQALGVGLTDDEVRRFTELGENFYKASQKIGNDIGNIDKVDANIEWGKAYKELNDYKESLMPRSLWQGLVQKLGRANMLASIKTPLLNIESNTISGITEAIGRRFSNWKATSSVEKSAVKDYMKFAMKMYKETGVDFTRMLNLDDTVTGSGKLVGERSQDVGVKALDVYADFIFNKTLLTPDVAFGSFAFSDSMALQASRIAKKDSKLATEIFKEATKLNPKSIEHNGIVIDVKALREQAIADSRMATYTNDSASSKFALMFRDALNLVPGLGDFTFPFVKTVANVAELGADYAGIGFVKAAKPTFAVGKQMMKGQEIDREAMRYAMTNAARSGIGMSLAYVMASQFNADDFMGAYDPAKTKIDQLSNATYNAIKVKTPFGEKWISTDFLGPIGMPFVAFMYSKKYGGAEGYISGATSQFLSQLPFLDAEYIFKKGVDLTQAKQNVVTGFLEDAKSATGEFISSRLTPGVLFDIARATDEVQRDTKQKKYVVDTPLFEMNFDDFVKKIPYMRENLPEKYDALGRTMYESSPIESMLFGSRVKNTKTNEVVDEIYRLRDAGMTPTIKDLRFMNSSKVDELKEKTGDKFYGIARNYGERLATDIKKEIDRTKVIKVGKTVYPAYKDMSDDLKQKRIGDIGQDLYEKILEENGIKYR